MPAQDAGRRAPVAMYALIHLVVVPALLAAAALAVRNSGLDLAIEDQFYSAELRGFPLRRAFWLEAIGHDLAKAVPIGVGILALVAAISAGRLEPLRRWRAVLWCLLLAMCIGPALITALKQVTAAHCPWDLARYGGYAAYTEDWFVAARADAGRCLPSGHAGAGFSLLALYFAGWAGGRTSWRWQGLAIGCLAGFVFGAVRTVQGAHFVSHAVWSAMIVWLFASLVFLPLICARRDQDQPVTPFTDGARLRKSGVRL